jgi:hypothetical protein
VGVGAAAKESAAANIWSSEYLPWSSFNKAPFERRCARRWLSAAKESIAEKRPLEIQDKKEKGSQSIDRDIYQ